MADYTELKAAIRAAIFDNTEQAITGESLQEILVQMVDELGESYVLPEGGIPASDLAQAVRNALAEAVSAYQLPVGGIPEADLAQAVRNALAAGLSAYQKPAGGIPETDLADGVIPTVPTISQDVEADKAQTGKTVSPKAVVDYGGDLADLETQNKSTLVAAINEARQSGGGSADAVKYTPQELTDAQKAQARTNIGATAPEIFWATYGTTTAAEIDAAVAAGKAVMCRYNNQDYLVAHYDSASNSIWFGGVYLTNLFYLRLMRSNNAWSAGVSGVQVAIDRVNTISGNETSTSKYPSTKAVADALGKMGVVSQTQTWTGSAGAGYDYTMSNIVRGLIPQEFIDRAVSHIGVSFNEQTGYFELNGLTDISYQEMLNIVEFFPVSVGYIAGTPAAGGVLRTRTIIPLSNTGTISLGYAFFSLNSIEVINFQPSPNTNRQTCNNINNIARGSIHLRVITGLSLTVSTAANADRAFENCYSLETAKLAAVRISLSFAQSSRLSLESVVYMVDNAYANSTFTLTLHATAYARCQADTTEYTHSGQTYTGILAYAAAKNITIASA